MNIALIIAGGSGKRMGGTVPKQFLEIEGKPILAYTIYRFQQNKSIDRIAVVCMAGWESYVQSFVSKMGLNKVDSVITGGETALKSIRNGVEALKCDLDDIVIVHDGVRPFVDDTSIENVIADAIEYGCAISAIPLVEHIVFQGASRTDLHYIPRENAFRTVTPQAYKYDKLITAFKKSDETGIGKDSPFIGTMMMDLGESVCLSKGSDKNIKITSPKDLIYFQSGLEQL